MNGKIALHFVIISFAVCHHVLFFPLLLLRPHIHPFSSLPLFIPLCPLQPYLILEIHSSPLHAFLSLHSFVFMYLPPFCQLISPSILSIFQIFHPPISLSTLMRSRMTMNTPIIMRKQQAFPPLRSPLPNLGPPINR